MTYLQRREVIYGLAGLTIAQVLLGRAQVAFAADKIKPDVSSALIVVDVQNCFLPGGSLAVKRRRSGYSTASPRDSTTW